jgi:hypothetical protein
LVGFVAADLHVGYLNGSFGCTRFKGEWSMMILFVCSKFFSWWSVCLVFLVSKLIWLKFA